MPDPTPAPDEMVVVAVPRKLLDKERAIFEMVGRTSIALTEAILNATPIDLNAIRREERAKAIEEAARVCGEHASELRAMAEDAGWRGEMDAFSFTARADVATRCARAIRALATAQGGKGGAG